MPFFLTAKHWQLFLLLAIPLVTFRSFGAGFSVLQQGLMLFLFVAVMAGWLYSVGMAANNKLVSALKMNTVLFKLSLALPVLYMSIVFFVVLVPLSQHGQSFRPPQWTVPVHFLALAGFAYALWFCARQFVSLQKDRRAAYIEFAFPLLGFWFGLLGVWFLQPKINQLLGGSPSAQPPSDS